MSGRIQGLSEEYLTGDALLKQGVKLDLMHVIVSAEGAVAGQRVVFRNGQNAAANPLFNVIIEAANWTLPIPFPQGKRFESGCFVDFEGAAGKIHVSVTYK